MAKLTDDEYEVTVERGKVVFETEPHARSVRFDRKTGMVIVDLYNDCTFTFPPRQLQGLEDASDEDLAQVEVNGLGYGLHWEALDADFTVRGLMAGRFGSETFMAKHRKRLRAIMTQVLQQQPPHAA